MVTLCLILEELPNCFPWLHHCTFPPAMPFCIPVTPHSLQHLFSGFVYLFNCSHPGECELVSYCGFLFPFFFLFGCATQHAGSQFPNQGLNLRPLHWKHGALTTGLPGKSLIVVFTCITIMTEEIEHLFMCLLAFVYLL